MLPASAGREELFDQIVLVADGLGDVPKRIGGSI